MCESRTNSSAHYQTPPLRLRHVWVVRYRCLSIASGEHEAETIYFHATPHISRTQYTANASRLRARLCSNHPLSTLAAVHNLHLALMQPAVAIFQACAPFSGLRVMIRSRNVHRRLTTACMLIAHVVVSRQYGGHVVGGCRRWLRVVWRGSLCYSSLTKGHMPQWSGRRTTWLGDRAEGLRSLLLHELTKPRSIPGIYCVMFTRFAISNCSPV